MNATMFLCYPYRQISPSRVQQYAETCHAPSQTNSVMPHPIAYNRLRDCPFDISPPLVLERRPLHFPSSFQCIPPSTVAESTDNYLLMIACLIESLYAVSDRCSKTFHFLAVLPKRNRCHFTIYHDNVRADTPTAVKGSTYLRCWYFN